MHPQLKTFSIISVLMIMIVALGLVFAPIGLGGTSPSPGNRPATQTSTGRGPSLLIKAEGTEAGETYASIQQGANLSRYLTPMSRLEFVVTVIGPGGVVVPGRTPTYSLYTNSSGEVEAELPPGNYSVQAAGSNFFFKRYVLLMENLTTALTLRELPQAEAVSTAIVVNQDTAKGVESTGTIYLEINGSFRYSPTSVYQLIGTMGGYPSPPSNVTLTRTNATGISGIGPILLTSPLVTINGTIEGSYTAPRGAWVVMAPTTFAPALPDSGVELVYYAANSTVSYIAG
ncbi:MAG: hypothetical protein JRN18_00140 [Nitrososphaerota archaeon]|nr:hypothetical protein [Nitrososphaerota archaeon]MDG6918836.1 hypothetical protein [Nitrososphaerota archaeon]MDG6946548.1 hypothetical protein [Nitrososphaerota archaeon]MDG6947705.1 hypothetical protein [Nitrososphaerota archaeon]